MHSPREEPSAFSSKFVTCTCLQQTVIFCNNTDIVCPKKACQNCVSGFTTLCHTLENRTL